MDFETIVVAVFIIATLVLAGGGIVLIFFGVAGDDDSDFPVFLRHKVIARTAAACLLFVALGFPVIAYSNEKAFPWSFLLSGVALLAAIRLYLGPKAQWATWICAGLVGTLLLAPLVLG